MRKTAYLLALIAAVFWAGAHAQSEDEGHAYLGIGATSLALDNDRIPGVPTSSPSHTSKVGSLILGYQFNDLWAADVSVGTDMSNNVDVDAISINGYRFLGTGKWRPFVSAGFSNFSIDQAPDDSTQQVQAGVGVSGDLNRNLELRVGYQLLFTVDDESYTDKALGASLAWHFRKPEKMAMTEPEPAPAPVEKEVIDRIELLVQFDFDKSNIKAAYEPQFNDIAQVLRDNPDITMSIEGHTCWIGTEEYNQGLSERRANSVKKKFVEEYGVAASRIETVGFGEAYPVADNNTLEGRRKNRRAIAVILRPRIVTE